jgi:hypothetical protein
VGLPSLGARACGRIRAKGGCRASSTLLLSGSGVAAAADLYPWRNHAAPFNFLFGNEIDTHQQTRQTQIGICSDSSIFSSPASSGGIFTA